MAPDIKVIILDVGNTLRLVVKDPEFQAEAKQALVDLVGAPYGPDEFVELLEERYLTLRKRAKTQYIEARETEMWTKWMLPDYPAEKIAPLSAILTRKWRDRDGRRVARSDVKETVIELHKRGYTIGIIANTVTETEIPDWLEEDDLKKYFKSVILSSLVGVRKPGTEIYEIAARELGYKPEECMYVGDNPHRDIEGAQAAGYGMTIIIHEPATLKKYPGKSEFVPDKTIHNLIELLDIFPPLNE